MPQIDVSLGEIVDKYSILEIKSKKIQDINRLTYVKKEMDLLNPLISDLVRKYRFHYECLYNINTEIWEITDDVKSGKLSGEDQYKKYQDAFTLNEYRFRIKAKFDKLGKSEIREQKSYSTVCIGIEALPLYLEYTNLNAKIRALTLIYDDVVVQSTPQMIKQVSFLFENDPHIRVVTELGNIPKLNLKTTDKLSLDIFKKYNFSYIPNISYIVSGKLGDLIHTMYVIYVTHMLTGMKGNLYITNDVKFGGDTFSHFERSYTELYNIIKEQPYINLFSVYTGTESLHINLNSFRRSDLLSRTTWLELLSKTYNIPLISDPWISLNSSYIDPSYSNTVLIHRSLIQFRHVSSFIPFLESIIQHNPCYFITWNEEEYNAFPLKSIVPMKKINTINEMYTAINSCKFFIGNQSSPLAIAFSIFKPCLAELGDSDRLSYLNSNRYYPEFNWISNDTINIDTIGDYITV